MKLKEKLKEGHAVNKNGYFNSYRENIFGGQMSEEFQMMFDEGSGGELHSKAEVVHSSSMLSYNFFHWINEEHPFKWKDVEYTKALFEVKMRTIIGSNAPANMDVVLLDKNQKNILFIESKFLEYTETKKFKLSKSYEEKNKYYNQDKKDVLREIVNYKPTGKYEEGMKQLITHLFGIYGLLSEDKKATNFCNALGDIRSLEIKFITLVFEPEDGEFQTEHDDYDNYFNMFDDFRSKLIAIEGLDVIPQWFSYSDLWKEMNGQISPALKEFLLKRYMRFAKV